MRLSSKTFLAISTVLLSLFINSLLFNNELFNKANNLYKSSEYNKALKLYKSIPNKSHYVNYNMGNCAYNLEQYGYALLYWRRAESNWGLFNKKELLDNIKLVKEKLNLNNSFINEQNPIARVIISLKNRLFCILKAIPIITIQLIFLFLWLFLFIYIRFLYKKRKKLTIGILFALIAFFGMVLVIKHSIESKKYGVILNSNTRLLSGPGDKYQELIKLRKGEELTIKKESSGYYKIKSLKRMGWVKKERVGVV